MHRTARVEAAEAVDPLEPQALRGRRVLDADRALELEADLVRELRLGDELLVGPALQPLPLPHHVVVSLIIIVKGT